MRLFLHPLTAATALAGAALGATALTATAGLAHAGAVWLLLVVAGAAAGFANSGST